MAGFGNYIPGNITKAGRYTQSLLLPSVCVCVVFVFRAHLCLNNETGEGETGWRNNNEDIP